MQGVRHTLYISQRGQILEGEWLVTFDPGSPHGSPADTTFSSLTGTVGTPAPRSLTLAQIGDCGRTITEGMATPDLRTIGGSGAFANADCGGAGSWFFTRR